MRQLHSRIVSLRHRLRLGALRWGRWNGQGSRLQADLCSLGARLFFCRWLLMTRRWALETSAQENEE
jgi:hypothetical protein